MRVILVGPPDERRLMRARLPQAVVVVGEAATMASAQAMGDDVGADALMAAASAPRMREVDTRPEALTSREVQVLGLMAEGLPNKRIADRLDISDQTVKFHVASICGKLGVGNRTGAVRRALQRGLIPL